MPENIITGRCNAVSAKVQANAVSCVLRMFIRLSEVSARQWCSDAMKGHPNLASSLFEMCPAACTCDSMSFVSSSLKDQVLNDDVLFCSVHGRRNVESWLK